MHAVTDARLKHGARRGLVTDVKGVRVSDEGGEGPHPGVVHSNRQFRLFSRPDLRPGAEKRLAHFTGPHCTPVAAQV